MPKVARIIALAFAAALFGANAHASAKVVYYNAVDDGPTALDELVHRQYDKAYDIVDFKRAEHRYVKPEYLGEPLTLVATDAEGKCIAGRVMAAYLVQIDGSVADARTLMVTDRRLIGPVLQMVRGWRFLPATLDGKVVATTGAQALEYRCH